MSETPQDEDMTEGTPDRQISATAPAAAGEIEAGAQDTVCASIERDVPDGDVVMETADDAVDMDMMNEGQAGGKSDQNDAPDVPPENTHDVEQEEADALTPTKDDQQSKVETPTTNSSRSRRNRRPSVKLQEQDEESEPETAPKSPTKTLTPSTGIPLSTSTDPQNLPNLQCYIRSTCVEYFAYNPATDGGSPQRGRRSKIEEGRVGIRCVFCKDLSYENRWNQSVAFPNGLDKIYSAVVVSCCVNTC